MNDHLLAVDALLADKDKQIQELRHEIARLHRGGWYPLEIHGDGKDGPENKIIGPMEVYWRYVTCFGLQCVEIRQVEDDDGEEERYVIPMDFIHQLARVFPQTRAWLLHWAEMIANPD